MWVVRCLAVLVVIAIVTMSVTCQTKPGMPFDMSYESNRCTGTCAKRSNCNNPIQLYHYKDGRCRKMSRGCWNVTRHTNAFYKKKDCKKACEKRDKSHKDDDDRK